MQLDQCGEGLIHFIDPYLASIHFFFLFVIFKLNVDLITEKLVHSINDELRVFLLEVCFFANFD